MITSERLYNLIALIDVNCDQRADIVNILQRVLKFNNTSERRFVENACEKYTSEHDKIQTAFHAFFDALHGKNRFNSDPLYHRGLELFGDYHRRNIKDLVQRLEIHFPELIER